MTATTSAGVRLQEFIARLTFLQFVELFGTMWVKEKSAFVKWAMWEGVVRDGVRYNGQPEMLAAFEKNMITWLTKARQLGGSEGAALYAIYLCLKYPKTLVLVFSKDYPAAEAFLMERVKSKIDGMLKMLDPDGNPWPWASSDGTLPWRTKLDGNCVIDGRIEFYNGSSIESMSSDNTGAIGRTPRLVILDEARTYAMKDAMEMWPSMVGALNGTMQIIVISTGAAGTWYNKMTKLVAGGGMPDVNIVFLPDDIRPGHDMEWRVRQLKILGGDMVRLKREHPLVLEDIFSTNEGLVIASWDEDVHVGGMDLTWDDSEEFFMVYDHGKTRGHPAVCWFARYNRYTDFLYVFDEVFLRGKELTVVGPAIKEKYLRYAALGAPVPTCIADTAIFSDLGVKTVAEVLIEETELSWIKAFKHDKKHSLELLQKRFFVGKILLDPKLKNVTAGHEDGSIIQVSGLAYKEGKDTPVEIEDDAVDVGRYLCAHLEHEDERPREDTVLEKNMKILREMEAKRGKQPTAEVNLSTVGAGALDEGCMC